MSGAQTRGGILENRFLEILNLLGGLGCAPFFGTALGLARNGNVIDGDDDIDLTCEVEVLDAATKIIQDNFSVALMVDMIDPISRAGARSFVLRFSDGLIHLDLYTFIILQGSHIFPVHWRDQRGEPDKWLHVPSKLAVAFRGWGQKKFGPQDQCQMAKLCEFLYGPQWRTPLRKNIDYIHSVDQGTPKIRPSTLFERTKGSLQLLYSNLYWGLKGGLRTLVWIPWNKKGA